MHKTGLNDLFTKSSSVHHTSITWLGKISMDTFMFFMKFEKLFIVIARMGYSD